MKCFLVEVHNLSHIKKPLSCVIRKMIQYNRECEMWQEVITLTLAVIVNGDQMTTVNIVGLVICLCGIVVHVILKATTPREYKQIHSNRK